LLCADNRASWRSTTKKRAGGDVSQCEIFGERDADGAPDLGGRKLSH
jgi:hypothetical protein